MSKKEELIEVPEDLTLYLREPALYLATPASLETVTEAVESLNELPGHSVRRDLDTGPRKDYTITTSSATYTIKVYRFAHHKMTNLSLVLPEKQPVLYDDLQRLVRQLTGEKHIRIIKKLKRVDEKSSQTD